MEDRFFVIYPKSRYDETNKIMQDIAERLVIDYQLWWYSDVSDKFQLRSWLPDEDQLWSYTYMNNEYDYYQNVVVPSIEKAEFVLVFLANGSENEYLVSESVRLCNNMNKSMIPIKLKNSDIKEKDWNFRSKILDYYDGEQRIRIIEQMHGWLGLVSKDEIYGSKAQKQQITNNTALWVTLGIIGGLIIAGIIVAIANSTNEEIPLSGTLNGHEWVDLGLPSGTKWATCNVGANSPEGYGDYFSWGETTTKEIYDCITYKYCNDDPRMLTKYCNNIDYGNNGFTDTLTSLEITDDAATANWGAGWCMPTAVEWEELLSMCKWTWMSNGYKVVGPNGNGLFFPAAGFREGSSLSSVGSYGYYWSSSLDTDSPYNTRSLRFGSEYYNVFISHRFGGLSVRPIYDENVAVNSVAESANIIIDNYSQYGSLNIYD